MEHDISALYERYCRPKMGELLRALGMDRTYVRASGDYLYSKNDQGKLEEVLDLVGGYGSTVFGHNHPDLVKALQEALAAGRPVMAQASCREGASLLAFRLNGLMRERVGHDFVSIFVNTGTEATEAAIKHSEYRFAARMDGFRRRVSDAFARAAALTCDGKVSLVSGNPLGLSQCVSLEELRDALERHNAPLFERPPAFLGVVRGFHGKTYGSLQLTHNPRHHRFLNAFSGEARFVQPDEEDLARQLARSERTFVLPVCSEGGLVNLVPISFVAVAAILLEPLQGEGGIHLLPAGFVSACRRACDEWDIALVFDEIQCGMGRTGTFLCSERFGVAADIYLLGKSLGGGLVKTGVCLVRANHFVPDFSMHLTSTFAEDDLSSVVALRALDLLVEGNVAERCAVVGRRLKDGLEALRVRFPHVIASVRGEGLMLGVEFTPDILRSTLLFDLLSESGHFGYVLAGYLLARCGVRIAPTLSQGAVIRLEPSACFGEEELQRTFEAFELLCEVLAKGNSGEFVRSMLGTLSPLESGIADMSAHQRRLAPLPAEKPDGRVAFIGHFISPEDLRCWDPGLANLHRDELVSLLEQVSGEAEPQVLPPIRLRSNTGRTVDFHFIGLCLDSAFMARALRNGERPIAEAQVRMAIEAAIRQGCSLVGLGGYTSIVTRNCLSALTPHIGLTSGNSLTVDMGLRGLFAAAAQHGLDPGEETAAVVGVTGNIGRVHALLLGERVRRLLLLTRAGREADVAPLVEELQRRRDNLTVEVRSDLRALREARLIVSATNVPVPIIFPEMIADGTVIINDLSVPANTSPSLRGERPRCIVMSGGVVCHPLNPHLWVPGLPLADGEMFACMAETATLGLEGWKGDFSVGDIRAEQVALIGGLADKHGFGLARLKQERSL